MLFLILLVYYIKIAIYESYNIFIEVDKDALMLLCKYFQNIFNNNQTPVFVLSNFFSYYLFKTNKLLLIYNRDEIVRERAVGIKI